MRIQYAIDKNGLTWSRVGLQVAIPVIDMSIMNTPKGEKEPYTLEKFNVISASLTKDWEKLRWTEDLPVSLKNYHRKFWGMTPEK